MNFACWVTKTTDKHTHNIKYLLLFHGSDGYANAPIITLFLHCLSCNIYVQSYQRYSRLFTVLCTLQTKICKVDWHVFSTIALAVHTGHEINHEFNTCVVTDSFFSANKCKPKQTKSASECKFFSGEFTHLQMHFN